MLEIPLEFLARQIALKPLFYILIGLAWEKGVEIELHNHSMCLCSMHASFFWFLQRTGTMW